MIVVNATDVRDAWYQATRMIHERSAEPTQSSRAGEVIALDEPVTTVYRRPVNRVLLDPVRDANPFFHFFESLWMLAGRSDAKFLDAFVSDYSARFAEDTGMQHGAYGRRWRSWFGMDQLRETVERLRADPTDRRVVIQMWDVGSDYAPMRRGKLRDVPCNLVALPRVVGGCLDLTVFCRSNDAVWGCYGANVVHFSVLQEYLAARIGVEVGTYTQISNNWHVYTSVLPRISVTSAFQNMERGYPGSARLVNEPGDFDWEVQSFLEDPDGSCAGVRNTILRDTAQPMWWANTARRLGQSDEALKWARAIAAPDWRTACVEWLERRRKNRAE